MASWRVRLMGYAELGLSLLAVLVLTWAVMEWSR
jgi:hypothetical protein